MLREQTTDREPLQFATKAETLQKLSGILTAAKILPLQFFSVAQWQKQKNELLEMIKQLGWFEQALIVRSSGLSEDSQDASLAGYYTSVLNVLGEAALINAIEEVIQSFEEGNDKNQILIQPCLTDITLSGVVFGIDPNTSGPYLIINYDTTGDSTSITAGKANQQCYVQHHQSPTALPTELQQVGKLVDELSQLFATKQLDIEFAIDKNQQLYLLQVRPLIHPLTSTVTMQAHKDAIDRISYKISLGMHPHPYLHGRKTLYGVMPDWNPAEIIGIRPKPLALSLYRLLVTDMIWAYQRDNYGYANLRSFPLLIDFEGLPYIDVRVSFNSFLPKDLPENLAEKLVNYYIDRLDENPMLHDKVEFDIVFSCYTLDLAERLKTLTHYGFSATDQQIIFSSLVKLTNRIIHNQQGLWKKDLEKISELERRQKLIFNSDLDLVSKMYWILEDCQRYGTLPFAGLARAGFVAIQILKSLVSVGIINQQEYTNFLSSLNSVSSNMTSDFQTLTKNDFLEKYGHLRPGTYDILSARYDEMPDLYFDWSAKEKPIQPSHAATPFALTISQLREVQQYIERDQLEISVLELLEFIKIAIESREYAKFIFSRSVSEFLRICTQFGAKFGLTAEDCSFLDMHTLLSLYSSSADPAEALHKSIALGKKQHQLCAMINLPPLITTPEQAWSFSIPESSPNFITQKQATGHIAFANSPKELLKNAILMIPSADPGYDWIFSHEIAGFITQYGGVNSHMAIRAGELAIPAVIGAGEVKFAKWSQSKQLHLDCQNKWVQLL